MKIKKAILLSVLLLSINSFGQWDSLNINFDNLYIKKINIVNYDTVFFLTSGRLMKSEDNGSSIDTIFSSNYFLYDLAFKNSNSGIIFTNDSIYKTGNGGITWQFSQLVSTGGFNKRLKYSGESSTYFAISAATQNTPDNLLLKTTDDGSSWTPLNLPTDSIGTTPLYLYNLYSSGADSLYLYYSTNSSGEFYETTSYDGGSSWSSLISSKHVRVIIEDSIRYAFNPYISNSNYLHRTLDSGVSWDSISFPNSIVDVHFVDKQHGVVACSTFVDSSNTGIYRTCDGGESWQIDNAHSNGNEEVAGFSTGGGNVIDLFAPNYGFFHVFDYSTFTKKVFILDNVPYDSTNCVYSLDNFEFEQNSKSIKVYPNPNSGQFDIELTDFDRASLKLASIDGKIIYQNSSLNLPVQHLSLDLKPGMYILLIESEKVRRAIKVLIE